MVTYGMPHPIKVLAESGFPTPGLAVAEVLDISDGRLRWTPWPVATRNERDLQSLVLRFIELPEAPDDQILKMARLFGPLGLCEKDNAPMCHGHNGEDVRGCESRRVETAQLGVVCPPRMESDRNPGGRVIYSEPVEQWRVWARRARAALLLAEELRRGSPGKSEYWRDALGPTSKPPTNQRDAAVMLAGLFELWRWAADLRPKMGLGPDGVTLRMWIVSFPSSMVRGEDGGLYETVGYLGGLFGAIGLHLLLSASAGAGVAQCDYCGHFYEPERFLRYDRRHYCRPCQKKGAKVTVYKRGQRSAKRVHAEARKH